MHVLQGDKRLFEVRHQESEAEHTLVVVLLGLNLGIYMFSADDDWTENEIVSKNLN